MLKFSQQTCSIKIWMIHFFFLPCSVAFTVCLDVRSMYSLSLHSEVLVKTIPFIRSIFKLFLLTLLTFYTWANALWIDSIETFKKNRLMVTPAKWRMARNWIYGTEDLNLEFVVFVIFFNENGKEMDWILESLACDLRNINYR